MELSLELKVQFELLWSLSAKIGGFSVLQPQVGYELTIWLVTGLNILLVQRILP